MLHLKTWDKAVLDLSTTPTSSDLLRVCSFRYHLKTFLCNGSCKNSGSSCAITSFLICIVSNILYKTSTNVLVLIFELNSFSHSHTILCDLWSSKALFNYYIFTLKSNNESKLKEWVSTVEPWFNEVPGDRGNWFIILRFFSIHHTITGLKNIVRYTEEFIIL